MTFTIRPMKPADVPVAAKLGARLARLHHDWDPARFMLPDGVAEGYAWWFGEELANRRAVLLVAAGVRGRLVGYAYGRLEPRDWNALRDKCGALHDVLVDDRARGAGVGRALVDAMVARLAALGAPRVVLMSASKNLAAQRLFARAGFRPTMVEMTRET